MKKSKNLILLKEANDIFFNKFKKENNNQESTVKINNLLTIFSPGRVNIIGEHTDYNNGFVFPAAIAILALQQIVRGLYRPTLNFYINHQIQDEYRATVISLVSLSAGKCSMTDPRIPVPVLVGQAVK